MSDDMMGEIDELEVRGQAHRWPGKPACTCEPCMKVRALARIARGQYERAARLAASHGDACREERDALQERAEKAEADVKILTRYDNALNDAVAENARLREALGDMVEDADHWRDAVEAIIGRQPRQDWPALARARAALRGAQEKADG